MDFFAFYAGFWGILLLITVAMYLLETIPKYKYLKVRGYQNAWMAFIPMANVYACVEATYGPVNYINVYGWRASATIIKLWAVVIVAAASVLGFIPIIGLILGLLLDIFDIAVRVQIFKDEMERLGEPQSTGFAILANIISIIGDITLLVASGRHMPESQNWQTDQRLLTSQTVLDGPLSFLNGSGNNAQAGYTYTNVDPNAQTGYTYTNTNAYPNAYPNAQAGYTPVMPETPAAPEAPVVPEAPAAPELTFTTDIPAFDDSDQDKQ